MIFAVGAGILQKTCCNVVTFGTLASALHGPSPSPPGYLRFHPEEKADDPAFAESLARLAEVYVNDAFGASHRAHAPVVGVPKHLPAVAGLLLEKEVETFQRILKDPERPFAAVISGAKVSDKLEILKNIIPRVDLLLIEGGMAATFFASRGCATGASHLETDPAWTLSGQSPQKRRNSAFASSCPGTSSPPRGMRRVRRPGSSRQPGSRTAGSSPIGGPGLPTSSAGNSGVRGPLSGTAPWRSSRSPNLRRERAGSPRSVAQRLSAADQPRIRRGYTRLINGDGVPLDRQAIRNTIHPGGTILETSRSKEFYTKEGRLRAAAAIDRLGLDGIILIGGEGTFHGATLLAADADTAALVGVPGSIDNDVYGTDYCIRFDTAANCAVEAIDRIRDTARSHERLFFIEVMGRTAGFLALESGIAGGAEELVIPEEAVSIARIGERIRAGFTVGKKSAIVVVAEGKKPGISFEIAREIGEQLNTDPRVVVLGHLQRGGPPTIRDRVLGSLLGVAAVEALLEGQRGCMVGEVGGDLRCASLEETWQKKKPLNEDLVRIFSFLSE